MTSRTSYYRYWAKSPSPNSDAHLAPYHNLDVAACGMALFDADEQLRRRIGDALDLDAESAARLVAFLLALHDVGKFADSFQAQLPDIARALGGPAAALARPPQYAPTYHGSLGALAWRTSLFEAWHARGAAGLAASAPNRRNARKAVQPLVDAVMGHHGRPVRTPSAHDASDRDPNGIPFFSDRALADARRFMLDAADLILPTDDGLTWSADLAARAATLSWTVAGVAVLADWLGSDGEAFPRTRRPIPLDAYWERARVQARAAVERAGVAPGRATADTGVAHLFAFDAPTPLQRYAETVHLADGPQLFVLEDLTGAGKTEAAVVLAHRLMQAGLANGLYVGLPTMATADQMFERLERAVGRLFRDPSSVSVVLAHSARDLSTRFRQIAFPAHTSATSSPADEAPADAQCAAWIASSRKRALLAALGVGTIDQALLGVLPAAHQSLRLLGAGRNVLVLDEVHAYDAYMLALVERLLAFQAAAGGSAVVLSATLPHATRRRLADAFRRGLGRSPERLVGTDYPLATHVHAASAAETPIARQPEARRSVRVERFGDVPTVVEYLVQEAQAGRCAVWVRNTVGDALDAFDAVHQAAQGLPDIHVDLLHARFALGHRLAKQQRILDALGPRGGHAERRGQIVVATQVVEQSLDLDADVLVSDLAPIDLLIQRAGRLRRHVRDARGNRLPGAAGRDGRNDGRGPATLGIFAPPDTETPDENWFADVLPGAGWVYPDHGRMWLTAREVRHGRTLTFPDDARALVRAVYGPDARACVPDALLARTHRAEADARLDDATGSANALRLTDGYGTDPSAWTHDDARRTRLGEPSVSVRLVAVRDGRATPLVDHPQWEMSDLAVRRSLIARAVVSDADRSLLDRARAAMPDRAEHTALLPLHARAEGWGGVAVDGGGRTLTVRYSRARGLLLNRV